MPDIPEKKKAWRRLAVDSFRLIPKDERRALDALLCRRAREYAVTEEMGYLLGYAPMLDEPDLSPFLRRWVAEGGRLALPVWLGGQHMLLREVGNLDTQLRPGRGGILEPVPECPEANKDELDLVITPGRFFSERLERLGRGSGCYDQLFRMRGMRSLGVAYDFQVVPALPVDGNDMPVDALLTPTRLIEDREEEGA